MSASGLDGLAALGAVEIAVIAILAIIQIGLLVWALVDIMRRTDVEVQGEKRWVWILVVLFVNMIGPIVYLIIGRKPRTVVDPRGDGEAISADKTKAAVDVLYGDESEGASE